MNIEEAKKQVKYAVISYLSKDEFGEYRIPVERQRPIFLMGPPGIGKTDIMNQVAEEMNIAVVSYSMSITPGRVLWVCRSLRTRNTAAGSIEPRNTP